MNDMTGGFPVDTSVAANFRLLQDVDVKLTVEIGSTALTLRELLALGESSVIELDREANELLDVFGDVGIDRLAGKHPAWVRIAPEFLLEVGTPPVRPDRVVLQIPAEPVTDEVLTALRRLQFSGYKLALDGVEPAPVIVGTVVSFLVGYASIAWLLRLVASRSIVFFVPYRIALGVAVLAVLAVT